MLGRRLSPTAPGAAHYYVVRASSVALSGDSNEVAASTTAAPLTPAPSGDREACGFGAIRHAGGGSFLAVAGVFGLLLLLLEAGRKPREGSSGIPSTSGRPPLE